MSSVWVSTNQSNSCFVIDNYSSQGPLERGLGKSRTLTETMMSKPVVLQMGAYPEWDEVPLGAQYDLRRYFEAENKDAFLAGCGAEVRAIATRGELGASRKIIGACPSSN